MNNFNFSMTVDGFAGVSRASAWGLSEKFDIKLSCRNEGDVQ